MAREVNIRRRFLTPLCTRQKLPGGLAHAVNSCRPDALAPARR